MCAIRRRSIIIMNMEQQDEKRYFVTYWSTMPKNNLERQLHALAEKHKHHLLDQTQIESVVQEAKQIVSDYKGRAIRPSVYWQRSYDLMYIRLCDSVCMNLTPVIED